MKSRAANTKKKWVKAYGERDDEYHVGPYNYYPVRDDLIRIYRNVSLIVMIIELAWLTWPILSSSIYGGKAVFAWVGFGPALMRAFFVLYSAISEQRPFHIASCVMARVPKEMENEQWLRWIGIHGHGRPHGTHSFFSKFVHTVILIIVLICTITTRHRFHADSFWVINSVLCILYAYYTFDLGWYWLIYGCAQPRENYQGLLNV